MIKYIAPILLLTISNIFMTFAWYGHLKFKAAPIVLVVLVSWGIAFFEYCFQVPANRIGSYVYNAAQLKTIQEVITLVVFIRTLPQRTIQMELPCRIFLYHPCGILYF